MPQKMRLGNEAKRRYSGKLTANGNRPKNVIPMFSVAIFMNSHAGTNEIARILTMKMASVAIVRLGTRHS